MHKICLYLLSLIQIKNIYIKQNTFDFHIPYLFTIYIKNQIYCVKIIRNLKFAKKQFCISQIFDQLAKYLLASLNFVTTKIYFNKQRSILCNTVNVFQTTPPFFATRIINPFLHPRVSAHHDKGYGFQSIVKSLHPLMFIQFRISFILHKQRCSKCIFQLFVSFSFSLLRSLSIIITLN